MISPELNELRKAYVAELRESKDAAEGWWAELNSTYAAKPAGARPEELWPAGPASHPWVIATYRKYFFLCAEHNRKASDRIPETMARSTSSELDWGTDEPSEPPAMTVEPKVFVLELLSGGDTHDLYEFLLSMVFVPIGLKADEQV
jgi:hypothetical protein